MSRPGTPGTPGGGSIKDKLLALAQRLDGQERVVAGQRAVFASVEEENVRAGLIADWRLMGAMRYLSLSCCAGGADHAASNALPRQRKLKAEIAKQSESINSRITREVRAGSWHTGARCPCRLWA